MTLVKDKLNIIIPLFNEADCIDELVRRLNGLRVRMVDVDIAVIFVDDGSTDATIAKLSDYAGKFPFVRVIEFSRNFGHQIAVTAGLDHADADFVAIIDADLQDPPELIEDMYRRAKASGGDIIYGKRLTRKRETWFKKIAAHVFYRVLNALCDIEIPRDTGDFRLVSRRVLVAMQSMREKHRFLRGMIPWVGFSSEPLFYHRDERYAGTTKYPLRRMLKFALDAIFSFSNEPLRLATYTGLAAVVFGIFGGLLILYLRLFTNYTIPGITAVILTMIFLGGIQIFMLGIIGEYIGRIFEEVKNRPLYIVKSVFNADSKESRHCDE